MRIGIDFDDTCIQTMESLLAYNNDTINNTKITREEITSIYLPHIKKLQLDEAGWIDIIKKFFGDTKMQLSIPAIPEAKEILTQRKKLGHTLYIITGRLPEMQKTTQQRIEKHMPDIFSDIIFASHFTKKAKNKIDICNDLDIQALVDDCAYNFADIENTTIRPILLEKPRSEYAKYKSTKIQVVNTRNDIQL